MKKLTRNVLLGISLTATAFAGTAYAAQEMRGAHDHGGVQTRAEVQTRTAERFARMDANKDGKLDQADREARRSAMFDRIDTDKNGQISRAEFSAKPQRPDGVGAGVGAGVGKGPDGEGGKHHRWGGRGRGYHGGMMMGRPGGLGADANKDGAVTQAEFTAAALQRFDATDANKDGTVTKDERQAARKAMREQWQAKRDATPAN